MIPVQFPESNAVLAREQGEYEPMAIYAFPNDPEGRMAFCMRLTDAEIEEIRRTRTLWIQQLSFGRRFQPIACGNCKYFGEPYQPTVYDEEGDEVDTPVYHTCELLPHLNGSSEDRPSPWPLAGVTDGSGYAATFRVREDFGCNQWEGHDG